MKSSGAEGCSILESCVELGHFLGANAAILGEEAELLAVPVNLCKVHQVLVDGEKMAILRGGREENSRVTAFNSIFLRGWLVVRS